MENTQESFASTYLGHFIFTQYVYLVDALKSVAEYNPAQKDDDDESPAVERRLPWILFIPIVIMMRSIRLGLSLMALVIKRPPISRNDVVGQRSNEHSQ